MQTCGRQQALDASATDDNLQLHKTVRFDEKDEVNSYNYIAVSLDLFCLHLYDVFFFQQLRLKINLDDDLDLNVPISFLVISLKAIGR